MPKKAAIDFFFFWKIPPTSAVILGSILNKLLTNGAVPSAKDGPGTDEVVVTPTPIIAADGTRPSKEIDPNGHDEV